MADPDLTDDYLDFGRMQIPAGGAFRIDGDPSDLVPIFKSWVEADGRTFLVESCEYASLSPLLDSLPASKRTAQNFKRQDGATAALGDLRRPRHRFGNPPVPGAHREKPKIKAFKLARTGAEATGWRGPGGAVLDYSILTSASGFTFKGDTTYLVLGSVNLSGTTTIEGGTVVKFTNAAVAKINILGQVDCKTELDWPATFTARDDPSVGEAIVAGGTPSGYYGNGLVISSTGLTLRGVRFRYADTAVKLSFSDGQINLAHAQFVQCHYAIQSGTLNNTVVVDNALFHGATNVSKGGHDPIFVGQHLTVDHCDKFHSQSGGGGGELHLTNSLVVDAANGWGDFDTVTTAGTVLNPGAASAIFQTVAAGSHYLAAGSPYRDYTGSTYDITPTLWADLKRMTTFPPLDLGSLGVSWGPVSADACLLPVAQRDYDKLDIGYHYPALDYLVSDLRVQGAALTLLNGVAICVYGTNGINLESGAKLTSVGSPVDRNRLFRYQAVQEQPIIVGSSGTTMTLLSVTNFYSTLPEVRMRYTDISLSSDASGRRRFLNNYYHQFKTFALTDCQWRGGVLDISARDHLFGGGDYETTVVALTNTLVQRASFTSRQGDSGDFSPWATYLYNNLFLGGSANLDDESGTAAWATFDNLFDTVSLAAGSVKIPNGYDGYISTTHLPQSVGGDKDITPTVDYQVGPLGSYYYPAGGTKLAQLINAGSRSASDAHLAHHTVRVDQTQEGTASTDTVDIGRHYAPVSAFSEIPKPTMTLSSSPAGVDQTPTDGVLSTSWVGFLVGSFCPDVYNGWLALDLGASKPVTRFAYQASPQADPHSPPFPIVVSDAGTIFDYEIYVTDDPGDWGAPVASGTWGWQADRAEAKIVRFPTKTGRYVYFKSVKAASNSLALNEVWVYQSDSASTSYMPLDLNLNGIDDYLEDWDLGISLSPCALVAVTDSCNDPTCSDGVNCSDVRQRLRTSSPAVGGSPGVDYIFAMDVSGVVEQKNEQYDVVNVLTDDNCLEYGEAPGAPYEVETFFFEGDTCGLDCNGMAGKRVTKNVVVRAGGTVYLRYDTVDENWHKNASALMNSATLVGARQPSLP